MQCPPLEISSSSWEMRDERWTNQVIYFKGCGEFKGYGQLMCRKMLNPATEGASITVSWGGQRRHLGMSKHISGT